MARPGVLASPLSPAAVLRAAAAAQKPARTLVLEEITRPT